MSVERFISDCIVPIVNLVVGMFFVMVGGYILWLALDPLVPGVRDMSSEMYVDIFDNAVLISLPAG